MQRQIEDYALIGDCETIALVCHDGSIDWLCWPRFDSDACFAALLGTPENGRWLIAPTAPSRGRRHYRDDTLILETEFETDTGAVVVIDFMPIRGDACDLVRIVVGRRGRVPMRMELTLRFDYGRSVPWVSRLADGDGLRAIAGPHMVVLRTPIAHRGEDRKTVAEFTVREGDVVPFVMAHTASHLGVPGSIDPIAALEATESFWRAWAAKCSIGGRHAAVVRRSLLTLKALTHEPTGGIVAAPTTSLPERIGGVRNWDYRYCWLRDATFTLLALMHGGYYDEARAWREWMLRAVAGNPDQAQIMYGIGGERNLPEWTLDWLPGFGGSAPVRVGNAASDQMQLDVFGEVLDALHQARRGGLTTDETSWAVQFELVEHLAQIWNAPDHGIWEVRSAPQHFVHSKVMAWVAVDRAVKGVEHFGLEGPVAKWRRLRKQIHDDVCRLGFDHARGTFVRSYGSRDLDASLLLMPLTGFLPVTDPRVRGTVDAIQRELVCDGLVLRYRAREETDGLPSGEGVFLACTFWLADVLALQHRWDEAEATFARALGLANDVGLLAEEYDPVARRLCGNFPQALSHVALVNSALNLARDERGPAGQRSDGQPPNPAAAGEAHPRSETAQRARARRSSSPGRTRKQHDPRDDQ
jgi:GH15 family glucan-1,4-alpha-glucosidase